MLVSQGTETLHVGNGTTVSFLIGFEIFNLSQVRVEVDLVPKILGNDFTLSEDPNTVTFDVAPEVDANIRIYRATALTQLIDYVQGAPFAAEPHEVQMDRIVMMAQEARADLEKIDFILPDEFIPNAILLVDSVEQKIINGPDSSTLTALAAQLVAVSSSLAQAQAAQSAAEAAQALAETAESNAMASELAAAASALDAQDASNNSQWRDVIFVTFADSPINLTESDAGNFYSVDTTAGNVVFNLPEISSLDLSIPRLFGGKKSDASVNAIIVNSSGSDIIDDGLTSVNANVQNNGFRFVPDDDQLPNSWTTIAIASAGGAVNPTLIEGTGGRIVTETTDMISGGLGSISNAGVYQIQNQAGTQVFEQQLSGQKRRTVNITELRYRYGTNTITSSASGVRVINEVNMASTGQTINLNGNSNQGYEMYFVKTGGEPFTVQGALGAEILGYPNGIELINDGDSVFIHQYDQNRYIVKGQNILRNNISFFDIPVNTGPLAVAIPTGTRIATLTAPALFDTTINFIDLPDPSLEVGQTLFIDGDISAIDVPPLGIRQAGVEIAVINQGSQVLLFSDGTNWTVQNTFVPTRRVRRRFLNTDIDTPTTSIAALTVGGLTPGRSYRVFASVSMITVSNRSATFAVLHNGSTRARIVGGTPNESLNDRHNGTIDVTIEAVANSVTFNFTPHDVATLEGNGGFGETYVEVEELPYRRRLVGNF